MSGLESQLSVAVATPVAFVEVEAVQITVVSAGQVITGGVVSVTLMVWLAELVLPQAYLAVQVRVMLLACAQAPGVVTSAKLRLGFRSQLSLTVGWRDTAGSPDSMIC